MKKFSFLTIVAVLCVMVVANAPALAQSNIQGSGQNIKKGPTSVTGPMSDTEKAPVNLMTPTGADFSGTFYRSSSSSYLERYDYDNNNMTGWIIYYPTDQGADIYGRLASNFRSINFATMGWSDTAGWGEVLYMSNYPFQNYTYNNAWGAQGSGSFTLPSGLYSGSFYESFFDGTADNFTDDASGSWSTEYGTFDSGPSSRVYDASGLSGGTWMTSTYGYGYSSSLGFNFNADVRRLDGHSNSYGLMFCADTAPTTDYYGFYIGTSTYSLWSYSGGSPTAIISWTNTSEISPEGEWTNLQVIGNGSTYNLYINGTMVNSFTDSTHTYGNVGVIGYDPDGTAKVQFDNVLCHRDSSKFLDGGFVVTPDSETLAGDDTGVF